MLNAQIAELAGPERVVVLTPDFEGVAGLRAHSHKPEHAWERFSAVAPGEVPAPLQARGRARGRARAALTVSRQRHGERLRVLGVENRAFVVDELEANEELSTSRGEWNPDDRRARLVWARCT